MVIISVSGQTRSAVPVVGSVGHPTEDVALLNVNLAGTDGGEPIVNPLAMGRINRVPLSVGEVVEIAGYGLTEKGAAGELRFLTEPIVNLNDAMITVSGLGMSGACEGDSGGPLLVRAADGLVTVLGVLSIGSSSCRDEDQYIRIDGIDEWVRQIVGPYFADDHECGTITGQGRCLYGSALWCTGTELAVDICASGKRCSWDSSQAGFRCVDLSADGCQGVDSVGACENGEALRCIAGVLERRACEACETCRIDGRTAMPYCAMAQ